MRSVSQLVDDLGGALVVGTCGNLNATVSAVSVSDPVHPVPMAAETLLVGVGHALSECAALQDQAEQAGVPAVLVKGDSLPEARESGPAVVVIDPSADWGHVIALARLSVSAAPVMGAQQHDSLFALADALAGLCGGSVVVHDPAWQLIAYSGGDAPDAVRTETLLGRRAPRGALDRLRQAGVVDRLLKGELVHLASGEIEGMTERYAAAVLVSGQLFGTIWVTPSSGLDENEALGGLRRAVDVAALALLRVASIASAQSPERDLPFAALLSGVHTERLVAERLKSGVDGGFVLAGLKPLTTDATERAGVARRLVTLSRSYAEAYRVPALVAAVHDTAFLLFPCASPNERPAALRVLTDLHGRLQRSAPHRAMISSTFAHLTEVVAMRSLVEELLELSERRGWSGLTDSETVQASWRLAQFREVALAHPALLEGPGMRLIEHDRTHGGGLLATLRAYFAAVGDVKAAASAMGLHYNTVRYRLRRASEVADINLDDPDERLLTELQVRLLSE
ncbi:MAG: helix-turn-helix domain-containing protein [Actinomycetota bacterium]|nr:helix-turn-helix domain-containing protein [Actinomycetota bacterium]